MADYTKIIPHIRQWEGGLSDHPSDYWYNYPAPVTYTDPKTGKTSSKWHTNKGIAWVTYKSYKISKGDVPNVQEWLKMPDNLWISIFKQVFWDYWNADKIISTPVANILVKTTWGSGKTGSLSLWQKFFKMPNATPLQISNHVNYLTKKIGEKNLFDKMWKERERYFISLNDPTFQTGWLNAWKAFKEFNQPFFSQKDKNFFFDSFRTWSFYSLERIKQMIKGFRLLVKFIKYVKKI